MGRRPQKIYEMAALKELMKRDMKLFLRLAWPVIEPGTRYIDGWHIDAIIEHLQAVSSGKIKRLLINMPPRHMKSTLIGVIWPAWLWTRNPSLRFLCASYSLQLAIRDNRKMRMVCESPWYSLAFGVTFSKDQNKKSRFENAAGGARLAASVGGALTGEGGDYIIVDDPHNYADVNSRVLRQEVIQWFFESLQPRLNSESGGIVVVQQRLHEEDLAGVLLKRDGWEHLILPAEYEPSRAHKTCIGWQDPRREPGEPLWPERFPKSLLEDIKKQIGQYAYAAQYMQSPVPSAGGLFRREWIKRAELRDSYILARWRENAIIAKDVWQLRRVIVVDLAISMRTTADYTVVAAVGADEENRLYVLDVYRDRIEAPRQVEMIRQMFQKWRASTVYVEKVAYQAAMIQMLLKEGIPVRGYKPLRDKLSRAASAATLYENERIYHVETIPGLEQLEEELTLFPRGSHDDFVDAVSMAVAVLITEPEPRVRLLD